MTHELSLLRDARRGNPADLEAASTYVPSGSGAGHPGSLEAHPLVSTDDPAEAERLAAPFLGRLRLTPADGSAAGFRTTLQAVVTGSITLGHLHVAAATEMALAASAPRVLVLHSTAVAMTARTATTTFEATPQAAVVVQPGRPTAVRCPAGAALLAVGIEQAAMLVHLRRLVGRAPDHLPDFEPRLDLGVSRSRRWTVAVELLRAELAEPGSLLRSGMGQDQMEEFLMSSLLYGHRSTYSSLLCGSGAPPECQAVTAAKQFIEMNLPDRLLLAAIAEAAGVSVRTLQAAFRSQLRTTPVAYIRSRRLDRARAELAGALPGSLTVTDVATRWGITHLGRFAAEYRARFGESPSHTLRRHRQG